MGLKGKYNAWIKPSGQFIPIGYMQHNRWAIDYFEERFGDESFDKIKELVGGYGYAHEALHKLGWVRLLTWIDGKSKLLGNCWDPRVTDDTVDPALTLKQKETIVEWCLENGYSYDKLFTE